MRDFSKKERCQVEFIDYILDRVSLHVFLKFLSLKAYPFEFEGLISSVIRL